MRHVISLLILALGVSVTAYAGGDCSIFEKIGKAGLNENASFWADYAKLAEKGEPNPKDVEALVAKYKPEGVPPASGPEASTNPSMEQRAAQQANPQNNTVELKKAAEKNYAKAPPQIQHKMDELLNLYKEKGPDFLRNVMGNSGWSAELLKGTKIYSIRLNSGYRATFTIEDDSLKILDIGTKLYSH